MPLYAAALRVAGLPRAYARDHHPGCAQGSAERAPLPPHTLPSILVLMVVVCVCGCACVCCVRVCVAGGDVVVIGDGQVTLGATVVKPNARKVRVIGGGKVIAGFAGSTADCFALLEHLEKKLDEFPSQLLRAGVELAKAWRMDRMLRHLEATVVAVDKDISITLTGNGDVISEPDNGVIGIGSGGLYAVSAAHALVDLDHLTARQVAIRAMDIASDVCIYTNKHFVVEAFERGVLLQGKDKAQREVEDWQHRDAQSAARKKLNDAAEKQHIQQLRQQPPLHTATAPAEHTASHHTPAPPAPHNDTAPPSSTDPKGGAGSPSAAQLPSPQSR